MDLNSRPPPNLDLNSLTYEQDQLTLRNTQEEDGIAMNMLTEMDPPATTPNLQTEIGPDQSREDD